ncbi:hypothetical protein GT037_004856 [Alternaria burnsii]|uniref:Heterokaryon incompatibility domain-containing protein n=1 Tax=Alternaria burnsii TaxID=1187904 RepID=A0A8H7EFF9_9PLEO|nr:uncharacterized protein GT037_004856 [Alternaria burnsii]KAF7676644.1 hypothetical protein GT037_004856 [Alternaria burnsii]
MHPDEVFKICEGYGGWVWKFNLKSVEHVRNVIFKIPPIALNLLTWPIDNDFRYGTSMQSLLHFNVEGKVRLPSSLAVEPLEWVNSHETPIMHIRGSPGAGKTLLGHLLISNLHRMAAEMEASISVLYSFHAPKEDTIIQDLDVVIIFSLLQQLALSEPHRLAGAVIQPLFETHFRNRLWSPYNVDDFLVTFKAILSTPSDALVVCVLDGLEIENEGVKKLVDQLSNLAKASRLRLFITSRPHTMLPSKLEDSLVNVHMENHKTYLATRDIARQMLPQSSVHQIVPLSEMSEGNLLWTRLASSLLRTQTELGLRNFDENLGLLPRNLWRLYTTIVDFCYQRAEALGKARLFRPLLCSVAFMSRFQPVSLQEIIVFMTFLENVSPTPTSGLHIKTLRDDIDAVLECCDLLITRSGKPGENTSTTILHPCHPTLLEWVQLEASSTSRDESSRINPLSSISSFHSEFTNAVIHILFTGDSAVWNSPPSSFDSDEENCRRLKAHVHRHPLYRLFTIHLPRVLRVLPSGVEKDRIVDQLVDRTVTQPDQYGAFVRARYLLLPPYRSNINGSSELTVGTGVLWRIEELMVNYIRRGLGLNVPHCGMPPLTLALYTRNKHAFDLLSAHESVDVNAVDFLGATALWHAANNNLTAYIEALLKRSELDVNKPVRDKNMRGSSPLTRAATAGHSQAVELLLRDPRVEIRPTGPFDLDPMTQALVCGQSECMKAFTSFLCIDCQRSGSPYRSLKKGEIRLLHVTSRSANGLTYAVCDLITTKLSDAPPFRALSYTWGNPAITTPILLNNRFHPVTSNLGAALEQLPAYHSSIRYIHNDYVAWAERNKPGSLSERTKRFEPDIGLFWIDALCINQSDLDEKSHQIPVMVDIYREAREVVMWLGKPAEHTGKAFNLLQNWGSKYAYRGGMANLILGKEPERKGLENVIATMPGNPFDPDSWAGLEELLERPYFTRAWIFQEICVAREITMMCGDEQIDFGYFERTMKRLTLDVFAPWNAHLTPDAFKVRVGSSLYGASEGALIYRHKDFELADGVTFDLLTLLQMTSRFQATDPRDKLYALYGVADSDAELLEPDYRKPIEEIFTEFVKRWIRKKQNLNIVCSAGIGLLKDGARPQMPSWVLDHRPCPSMRAFNWGPHFCADGAKAAAFSFNDDERILAAKGLHFDSVKLVFPRVTSTTQPFPPELVKYLASEECPPNKTGFSNLLMLRLAAVGEQARYPHVLSTAKAERFFRITAGFLYALGDYTREIDGQTLRRDDMDKRIPDYIRSWLCLKWRGQSSPTLYDFATLSLWEAKGHDVLAEFLNNRFQRREGTIQWPLNMDPEAGRKGYMEFLRNCKIASGNDTFYVTENGLIGIAPPGIASGDEVVCLRGCNVPVVLKHLDDGFSLHGSTYVASAMHGEADRLATLAGVEETLFEIA